MPDFITETLSNPQMKHAAFVHLPAAIAFLGVIALAALAVTRGRSRGIRRTCVVLFLIGAASGFVTKQSGEDAEHELDVATMSEAARETLEHHEKMGERVWVLLAATGIVASLTCLRPKPVRWIALVLSVTLGLYTAYYTAVTGHHGGTLVYEHGVGVPASENNFPAK